MKVPARFIHSRVLFGGDVTAAHARLLQTKQLNLQTNAKEINEMIDGKEFYFLKHVHTEKPLMTLSAAPMYLHDVRAW